MPYVGKDWRSPGLEWVKTEEGWQPLADIHDAIEKHLHQPPLLPSPARSWGSSASSTSISSPNFTDDEERRDVVYQKRSKSRCKLKPAKAAGDFPKAGEPSIQEKEQHLQEILRNLTSRYATVVRATSSRESHHYFTLTEALIKMNFECAVEDQNCFPFICNILTTIFAEGTFLHSTATLRKVVHRVTDRVIHHALKTRMHTGLVLNMIAKAKAANKLLREKAQFPMENSKLVSSTHLMTIIDTRLKSLSKMKHQLKLCLRSTCATPKGALKLLDLPDDCLRKVMSFLRDPQDVLNLGLVNTRLYTLTVENPVWIGLYSMHHSECNSEELPPMKGPAPMAWMHFFSGHTQHCNKISEETFHAVTLCNVCSRVFWTGYEHPCFISDQESDESGHCSKPGLAANQFLSLFFV